MKALYLRTMVWSPVLFRGTLWFFIAVFTSFLDKTADFTIDELANWSTLDTIRLTLATLVPGLITIRTFLDQTVARHAEKMEETKSEAK